jgi:CheY-like chemotaxis protein
MKVFVVEDQPVELKLVVHVLTAAGHEVDLATAAEGAFQAIQENQPDVILLDMALPRMNGLALARALKSDPRTRAIPIVAVTSYPEEFSETEAAAAGCNAYFLKPLSTRTLPDMLAKVVVNGATDTDPNCDPHP